ncbi:beta-galactosidase [Bifidobacterium callitrichidarum]|uniref:beta-galactosidase n=1 Tax=Bifidobacterium callitrichidarum TaxID=2052941 RepID=A0A2U2ND88_9BIFI|nr:beta-galactosidase [Bifidobacterium callitrichidarum]PWG66994.1 beta-galactosidase [Bifidobacterium callitrichidarum]
MINQVLFGAAYYDEYMPYDRLDEDIAMLKAAHMNTVRIAESTWATMEPHPGEFNFVHIDRVIDAMEAASINVIVGTPTYAVPAWLTRQHPEILVRQHTGQRRYGSRQIMDIINVDFRSAAERVIRALVAHVAGRKSVIGFQLDNETKFYDALNDDMQQAFIADLRSRFNDDLDAINAAFGLNYWSNRITSWEDFPDLTETINGSLAGVFDRFRRGVVTEYLNWQAAIVREYARNGQFITQNQDLEWRGYSYGIQPNADHFSNAGCLDYSGVDIYHPTESRLTGKEIAFGGDLARSTKGGRNYLLLETEAQGQNGWLPYPGQLRLQAYSHLASGSNSVMYWHWHSIHNSFETYWKGILSHDFEPNLVYAEAARIGKEINQIGYRLVNLEKHNRVALIISNDSLSALNRFTLETGFPKPSLYSDDNFGLLTYNDVVRWIYDSLYENNIEVDILSGDYVCSTIEDFDSEETTPIITADKLAKYNLVITPALYCASQSLIDLLRGYVANGGHLLSSFRSFVANRDVTVWHDRQPHGLSDVFGIRVGEYTRTDDGSALCLAADGPLSVSADGMDLRIHGIMELLEPVDGTQIVARYAQSEWHMYAAVTRNTFGRGWAEWIGTMISADMIRAVIRDAALSAGIRNKAMELANKITVRQGVNKEGRSLIYMLNYTSQIVRCNSMFCGIDLLSNEHIALGQHIAIDPWGVKIIEEY